MVRFYIYRQNGYPTVEVDKRVYYCDSIECRVPTKSITKEEEPTLVPQFAMTGEGYVYLKLSRKREDLDIMECLIEQNER